MKGILGLVGALVGLFVGSIVFFLFMNGMLRTKAPFLVAARGYTEGAVVDSLTAEDGLEDLVDATGEQAVATSKPANAMPPTPVPRAVEDTATPAPLAATADASRSRPRTGIPEPTPIRKDGGDSQRPATIPGSEQNADSSLLPLESGKLERLVRVYEKMRPKQVALILDTMPDEQSVAILANMKERAAAQVMAGMDPQKAARMSRLLVGRENK